MYVCVCMCVMCLQVRVCASVSVCVSHSHSQANAHTNTRSLDTVVAYHSEFEGTKGLGEKKGPEHEDVTQEAPLSIQRSP